MRRRDPAPFVPGDCRYLAMLAGVALALLVAALLYSLGALLMKRLALVAALAVVSLSLSGCITSQLIKDLSPEAKRELALKFFERCGGTVNIGAGGASGQLGGALHGEFQLNGTCPPPQGAAAATPAS